MRFSYPLILLLLSACAAGSNLEALRDKKPVGESFNQILAAEYLGYAESLAEEGHPIRTNRFSGKGLDALAGSEVAPEESDKLAEQRKALMAVLTPDVKEIAPAKAARAQMMFDCWADGKKLCEEEFASALSDVEFIADVLVHGSDNRFALRFAEGSTVLSDAAETVLDVVAKKVAGMGEYQVELMAYGFTPKAPAKIKALASRRVIAIEKGLIKRGVDAGRIHRHTAGSSKEVFLSIDVIEGGQDNVGLSIQTYGQPEEAVAP